MTGNHQGSAKNLSFLILIISPSLQPPTEKYSQQFGFTENEVFKALKSYHLSDKESLVKSWYDGVYFWITEKIFIIHGL